MTNLARDIPDNSYLNRRIDRAYTRMVAARTAAWAHAWGDALVANCKARNELRSVAELCAIEKARGLRK
jgi:hypothetical protein